MYPQKYLASLDDLAIFGAKPAFTEHLHVGRPNIGNRLKFEERVTGILDRKWLTNEGPLVKEFEQRIASFVGVKHCIATCNATIALQIAIRAMGLTGEVIVPSFTFIATAHALQWQGIKPVFCDIDPETYVLDPSQIEQLVTPETTGIIGVPVWGRVCDSDALEQIARKRNMKLLFDSAHALGCSYQGRMIGGFGDAEVFSFHATKFINAFEGGAIVTNDDELALKIQLMRNFGFTNYDQTDSVGTNGKMNEISAAMGLTNLESIDEFVSVNRSNHRQYQEQLSGVPGLRILPYDPAEKCNYQYVVLEMDETIVGLTRDYLMRALHAENVLVRRYFYPGCHRMEPYRSSFPDVVLPETERVAERVLCLPTGTGVTPDQIAVICKIVLLILEHGREVSLRLSVAS
ncbi:MAG TPA: aminotransferase class I/II-fold pyridoxal phosphate-dependent enzyme [Pyrinomonadaceae bacterium]|nr:aminotransferase class I/II-fold pyridoxal phosphate-dependent enzyme [Pyrinomonadaceae bacterium]